MIFAVEALLSANGRADEDVDIVADQKRAAKKYEGIVEVDAQACRYRGNIIFVLEPGGYIAEDYAGLGLEPRMLGLAHDVVSGGVGLPIRVSCRIIRLGKIGLVMILQEGEPVMDEPGAFGAGCQDKGPAFLMLGIRSGRIAPFDLDHQLLPLVYRVTSTEHLGGASLDECLNSLNLGLIGATLEVSGRSKSIDRLFDILFRFGGCEIG